MPTLSKSIILEGANGSGKSTLAKILAEVYEVPIIHATKPGGFHDAINRSLSQALTISPVIFDRCHAITRLVYQSGVIGPLERDLLKVYAAYMANTCTVIYCTGNGERDMDKPHYTDELKEETKDQRKIRELYDQIMANMPHQKYHFKEDAISSLQL